MWISDHGRKSSLALTTEVLFGVESWAPDMILDHDLISAKLLLTSCCQNFAPNIKCLVQIWEFQRKPKTQYRDFKNKLHKVNGVFRPLQCFTLPEILCSNITRVAFLKIENKKMTIGQVEELWRSRIWKPRKLTIVETFNFCTIRRLNLTSHFTEIFSSKFQVWLILFRI